MQADIKLSGVQNGLARWTHRTRLFPSRKLALISLFGGVALGDDKSSKLPNPDNFPGTSGPPSGIGLQLELSKWRDPFDQVPTQRLREELERQRGHLADLNKEYPARKGKRLHPAIRQRKEAVEEAITLLNIEVIKRKAWETKPITKGKRRGRNLDEDVAERRAVVRTSRSTKSVELCRAFDKKGIQLPSGEEWINVRSWTEAHKDRRLRRKIQSVISQDRKRG
jgi:hypothetical protein